MSFIQTVAPRQATGEVRAMYARQQAHWGYVPNYAKAFSHRPEVLARWGKLLAEIRRPVDARRFELITFAAAHALRNTACALAHGKALTQFFSADEVVVLAECGDAETLSAAEREMMAFARKVACDAASIDQADTDALRRHGLGDADIFDIVAIAAGRAFFTKILDGLGVLADSAVGGMDEGLVRALTVGRPIDRGATQCLTDELETASKA
ncbi:MAG: hypothetical protein Q7J47_23190 [Azoarcus sp.]|nr:hypothetical protein [Azoarcus sp.]